VKENVLNAVSLSLSTVTSHSQALNTSANMAGGCVCWPCSSLQC